MPQTLFVDTHGGVQTITLNRPEKLNALSRGLLDELIEVVNTASRDDAVRVLVVTGAGRAFSAGGDISEFRSDDANDPTADSGLGALLRSRANPLVLRLHALEKPVLAAVNGVAAGAGMSLALACDLRYAAESAKFIQSFVGIGLVPDTGSSYFLPRLVGAAKALELAWTAEPVSAAEALDLGLVNRVVPDGALLDETQAFAARLARGPRKALALIKRGMGRGHERSLERALELEADYQEIASSEADFAEGLLAFTEKRPPAFGQ